ncbi:MAG: hypothetical protein KDE63_09295 [Novosphingobium sp.]|nr:hypothetical protein [Novosphingobium sp.]
MVVPVVARRDHPRCRIGAALGGSAQKVIIVGHVFYYQVPEVENVPCFSRVI